jgi:hypothetical protein
MKEETIFVSNDGAKFESKEDCLKWEKISENMGAIDTYARDGENRKDDFQPLKELIDSYLHEFSVDMGEFQDYFHHPYGSDCEDTYAPKVRIKHLELLMKTMNYIFYGSINPCVGD